MLVCGKRLKEKHAVPLFPAAPSPPFFKESHQPPPLLSPPPPPNRTPKTFPPFITSPDAPLAYKGVVYIVLARPTTVSSPAVSSAVSSATATPTAGSLPGTAYLSIRSLDAKVAVLGGQAFPWHSSARVLGATEAKVQRFPAEAKGAR